MILKGVRHYCRHPLKSAYQISPATLHLAYFCPPHTCATAGWHLAAFANWTAPLGSVGNATDTEFKLFFGGLLKVDHEHHMNVWNGPYGQFMKHF